MVSGKRCEKLKTKGKAEKWGQKFVKRGTNELVSWQSGWWWALMGVVAAVGLVAIGVTSGVWQLTRQIKAQVESKIEDIQTRDVASVFMPVSPTPVLPTPAPLPELIVDSEGLELTAESYLAMDAPSGVKLLAKNENEPWPPASITKVMTAMIAMENYPLDEIVEVKNPTVEGMKIDLVWGEQLSVENLLYGMLVASGNDAAEALARHYPEGREKFMELMNEKTDIWHLADTRFTNPSGIDDKYHFSTANDLARLTAEALKNELFTKIITIQAMEIEGTTADGEIITHQLENTNQLLNEVEGVKGVKTGWTEESGESLVTLTERNERKLITVMLGSQDRFGETKELIKWVFRNVKWEDVMAN